MGTRGARGGGRRLLAVYTLASLLPVVVIGAMLLIGYQSQGLERGRQQGRAQAAVIEQMAISPALTGEDLDTGLTSTARSNLQSATDLAIYDGSVSRLRIRSFAGGVLFSDDGSVLGAVPTGDAAFQRAANGQTDATVLDAGGGGLRTIRVLQPIIATSNGQATGVLELYLPYDSIAKDIQAETRRTLTGLAAGLAALYAVLALMSWWTTRSLRRHAAIQEHSALHDPLTGLPNREWFRLTLEDALVRARHGELGAVVLVDLNGFKQVNDTLGHHAGDELLKVVGQRLQGALRTDDSVARLGGDEFGLVLPRVSDRASTVALLERVRAALAEVVVLSSTSLSVQASFGISFYPDDAHTVEELLQQADAAMYQGKRGPAGVVVYEATTAHRTTHALALQSQLRHALEHDELVLHYQPRVALATGAVVGVEALVRWQHPERGLLMPSQFVPAAERADLGGSLTTWVLRRALADLVQWRRQGLGWAVAVNVSVGDLESPQFADHVAALLAEAGCRAGDLRLEVAAAALATGTVDPVVRALAVRGVGVAVDGFGAGAGDLAQLRDLPVVEVQISGALLQGGPDDDRTLARCLIDLVHGLGCTASAVGVERAEVAGWLRSAGCDVGQGYHWAAPAPWQQIAPTRPSPPHHGVDRPLPQAEGAIS